MDSDGGGSEAMRGSEDDVVILVNPRADANELVTRARQRLIFITDEDIG